MRCRPRRLQHSSLRRVQWHPAIQHLLPRRALGRQLHLRVPRGRPPVASTPTAVVVAVAVAALSHLPAARPAVHHQVCTHLLHIRGQAPSICGPTAGLRRLHRRSLPFHSTATVAPQTVVSTTPAIPLRPCRMSTGSSAFTAGVPGALTGLSGFPGGTMEPHPWRFLEPGLPGAVVQHHDAHPAGTIRVVRRLRRWLSHDRRRW
jgi:hypothetical protein